MFGDRNPTFVNNSREWIATVGRVFESGSMTVFSAIRKDATGHLVIEDGLAAFEEIEWENLLGRTRKSTINVVERHSKVIPLSAAPSGARVLSYSVCVPKN
jgi:hypothetical protein